MDCHATGKGLPDRSRPPGFAPDSRLVRTPTVRDVQFSGIACARELASAGEPATVTLRMSGVPQLVSSALARFGEMDADLRSQAKTALRYMQEESQEPV